MPEAVRRYFLRKKEMKSFLQEVSRTLGTNAERMFGAKPQIEVIETAQHKIYVTNRVPILAKSEEQLFPTLLSEEYLSLLPKIVVDMGAVPYICNGADVMAPGIAEIQGDFKEESLVVVLDVRNRKPIAIARSLFDSETSKTLKKGRIFRNLHHVGDDVWDLVKESH